MEVPALEVVRTVEVSAIEAERTRAEPTKGVRPPPAKEEAKEDESLSSHMVEVSLLPLSFCEADLFLEVLSCNACVFVRLLWIC